MNDAMSIGTAVPWEVLGVSWQSLEGSGLLNAGLLSEVPAWQVAAAQCHFYPELLVLELGLDVSVFSVLLRTVQSPCKPDPTPRPPLHVHLPCRIHPHCVPTAAAVPGRLQQQPSPRRSRLPVPGA